MNEETGKTKAIIGPSASNKRMRELLQKVAGIAEAALANQPEGDGLAAWRHLGAAVVNVRKAMRPEPGTLAFMDEWAWFEKKMVELRSRMEPTAGSGAFFTNEKVLKEVAELVKPREKPLDPNAPEMVRGEKPWKPLEIPECGIGFKRYHSADCEVYICAWQAENCSTSHVYEIRMRKAEGGKWVATLSNDGRKLCTLGAPSRQLAYRCALGAMRDYLKRGHRRTLRRVAAAAAAAGNQPTNQPTN